ncbi:hypothetical protein Sjap_017897 [Stephania japonica]|uniref:Uncharacterized protein n=1 Tax=Stephania japonica TaxID=461633 RepID=A0AAP0NIS4_9MAGN
MLTKGVVSQSFVVAPSSWRRHHAISYGARKVNFPLPFAITKARAIRASASTRLDAGGSDDLGGKGGGSAGGGDNNNNNNNNNNEDDGDKQNKKMAMSMSQKLTLAYAALVGVGGVMGYVKSGSQKSLAAGGLSALLLYYVYTELPSRPAFASSLGLGLSAALLAVMGSRFKNSGKIFPAGVVSLVSLVMSGGYLHVLLLKQIGEEIWDVAVLFAVL